MSSQTQARLVRLMSVLWPAFMASIVLEGLVFSAFDPLSLRWTDAMGEPLSPLAVYTLGFLVIWAAVSAAVALARSFPEPRTDERAPASA
jgi:hypothetical protein